MSLWIKLHPLHKEFHTWLFQEIMREIFLILVSRSFSNHSYSLGSFFNTSDSGGECGVPYEKRFPMPNVDREVCHWQCQNWLSRLNGILLTMEISTLWWWVLNMISVWTVHNINLLPMILPMWTDLLLLG